MYTAQHEEVADHAKSPTNQWVGGEITSNHNVNDQKLGEDKKANWPGHLTEIVQAYNVTQSNVMGYSPHYLMFGCRPRLQVTFTSPPLGVQWSP